MPTAVTSTPRNRASRRLVHFLAPTLVVVICGVVFARTVLNGFVSYDDPIYVLDNGTIHSIGTDLLRRAFQFHAVLWIPLVWISLALDHAAWGLDPAGYHLTNLLLHTVNAALVYAVVRALLGPGLVIPRRAPRPAPESAEVWTTSAALAALFWALHPLRVESVAWITERKDVLSGTFALLCVMAYLRHAHADAEREGRRWGRWYVAALASYLLALLAKPSVVPLPLVLLVLDTFPLDRARSGRSGWRLLLEKVPFMAGALVSAVLTALAQRPVMMDLAQTSLVGRVLIAAHSVLAYLKMTLWPSDLGPFYPHPNDAVVSSPRYWLALLTVAGGTAILVVLRRRIPALLAAWSAYALLLVPVLGLVQVAAQEKADRFTYLPSIVLATLLGAGARATWRWVHRRSGARAGVLILVAASAVLASEAALTWRQIAFWRDGVTFWTRVIDLHPSSGIAYFQRAGDLRARGDLEGAVADLTTSIEIAERKRFWHRARIYAERGRAYLALGRPVQALSDFERAIALGPADDEETYRADRAMAISRLPSY